MLVETYFTSTYRQGLNRDMTKCSCTFESMKHSSVESVRPSAASARYPIRPCFFISIFICAKARTTNIWADNEFLKSGFPILCICNSCTPLLFVDTKSPALPGLRTLFAFILVLAVLFSFFPSYTPLALHAFFFLFLLFVLIKMHLFVIWLVTKPFPM